MALYARDVRGAGGQVVDASITDACFAMLESAVVEYEKTGFVREPTGPRLPRIAPSNVYRSSDGRWVVIAANHDTLWRRLATLMGRPELADDPRFDSHHARGENEDLLDELIGEWAAQHTAEELDRIVNDGRRGLRARVLGGRHLRGPALPRARAARPPRGRGPRVDDGPRRRPAAVAARRDRSAGPRAGRSAPTRTPCWAASASTASASPSCATPASSSAGPLPSGRMRIGTSLALVAVGLVLAYAVDFEVPGIELRTLGSILFFVGLLGLALSVGLEVLAGRRRRAGAPPPAGPAAARAGAARRLRPRRAPAAEGPVGGRDA